MPMSAPGLADTTEGKIRTIGKENFATVLQYRIIFAPDLIFFRTFCKFGLDLSLKYARLRPTHDPAMAPELLPLYP